MFNLAYGTEVVLSPEMMFLTLRVENFEEGTSKEGLKTNLDLLDKQRAEAHLRVLAYKRATARLHNRRVRPHQIKVGDLILRKTEVTQPELGETLCQTEKDHIR